MTDGRPNSVTRLSNWIAGEPMAPVDGAWFPHVDPTTGKIDCEVPDSGQLDVVFALQAANKALPIWQRNDARARAAWLEKAASAIEAAGPDLAHAQALDVGTPVSVGAAHSVGAAAAAFRAMAREITESRAPSVVTDGSISLSHRLPIGVVALLTTWSDSLAALAPRVAAALACGNAVILKPSELAPRTADRFVRALVEAGLPAGIVGLVQGRGESVGAALVAHPAISTLSFVGKNETAKSLLRESAEFLKRTHLSLGARNPVLVFNEVDVEKSAASVAAICSGTHPSACLRGSRLFIQEGIYDKFLEAFKVQLEKLVIGDPLRAETQLGPLPTDKLVSRFHEAAALAQRERGKVLTGGGGAEDRTSLPSEGHFVRPTAVYDFTLCSTLQQEEVMGPLITIASFKYLHDGVKQANNSLMPRAAYVFHPQADKLQKIATKIEASRIFLNAAPGVLDLAPPDDGIKGSGLSRGSSSDLVEFFSRRTTWQQFY